MPRSSATSSRCSGGNVGATATQSRIQKGAGKGKGKKGKIRRNDGQDEALSEGPMAAEGLAMQSSTTVTAFAGKVVSIVRISDDWDSINIAFTKTTKQSLLDTIPGGLEEYGPATWTRDPAFTGPNVGIQVGQFLSIDFREWQSGRTQDTTAGTATAHTNDPAPKGNEKGTHPDNKPSHQDRTPIPADGLGSPHGTALNTNVNTPNQPPMPTMMRWAVQGLVQETQAPDKSGEYKGPTNADRSQLTNITILVHKNHRHYTNQMLKEQTPCDIEALARTNGIMKLTNMAQNVKASDIDQLTAHGSQPDVKDKWTLQQLDDDPNVLAFNSKAQVPHAALQLYTMVAATINSLLKDIPNADTGTAELAILLDRNPDSQWNKSGYWKRETEGEERMALIADITAKAPTIDLSFLINGCQGTLALIAELLQPESPLIADILIVLAQVSLGAQVDSREGPPGTGKSHVKGLLQLVIEILKLTRVDQPKLGKDLTIMQSA